MTMPALHGEGLPSAWRAYAAMLLRRRHGLSGGAPLPPLERHAARVRIDPAWLAAYRAIVGLPADAAAPLPALALQIAAAPLHLALLADAAFPFRAFGLVHVAQRVEQFAALSPTAEFALSAFTGPARPARKGTEFDLVTEAQVDGCCAWRSITTALARGAANGSPAPAPVPETVAADLSTPWQRGAELHAAANLGRRYAALAGDLNPIHQHAWLARPFGFERAIVHGTWTLARALAAAGWPSAAAFDLRSQFRRPVLLPADIAVEWRRLSAQDELRVVSLDGATVHLRAQLSAPAGQRVTPAR